MTIAELIAAARKVNPTVCGVLPYAQGVEYDPYTDTILPSSFVAICVTRDGKPTNHRSWNTHPTPEAALADLASQLED